MSDYTIIGAGQGGLHLALALLRRGGDVTLISDKTPQQYLALNALSSHTLQRVSIDIEGEAGANLEDEIIDNPVTGMNLTVTFDGREPGLTVLGDFAAPCGAIDSRLKNAALLERVVARGGNVEYRTATVDDVEAHAAAGRTVFVASGKGELGRLFALDEERTVYDRPQRNLTFMLVSGLRLPPEHAQSVNFVLNPTVGESFWSPNVHKSNTAVSSFLVEARPGGPLDLPGEITSAQDAERFAREAIDIIAPWAREVFADVRLADERCWLRGAVRPLVRRPVGTLPSGRSVYGVGDVLMVHDPVAGLGGNCVVAGVKHLLDGIDELGGRPLTAAWYEQRMDAFWERDGQYFTRFANMLLEPPSEAVQTILGAAGQSRALANRFFGNWADPKRFWPYVDNVDDARRFVAEGQAETQSIA